MNLSPRPTSRLLTLEIAASLLVFLASSANAATVTVNDSGDSTNACATTGTGTCTLRDALTYPRAAADYEDAAIARALADVGLDHLRPLLDTTDRWDRRLRENEKQSLAFARVCLQRPQWLVVNGAFDALDRASRAQIEALFWGPLSDVGLVDIGEETAQNGFFKRKLHLVTDPNGPTFRLVDHCVSAPA